MMVAAIRNGAARSRNSPHVLRMTNANAMAPRAGFLCATRTVPKPSAPAAKNQKRAVPMTSGHRVAERSVHPRREHRGSGDAARRFRARPGARGRAAGGRKPDAAEHGREGDEPAGFLRFRERKAVSCGAREVCHKRNVDGHIRAGKEWRTPNSANPARKGGESQFGVEILAGPCESSSAKV